MDVASICGQDFSADQESLLNAHIYLYIIFVNIQYPRNIFDIATQFCVEVVSIRN